MKAKPTPTSAFSLVEVVVALGLFSFCIAAITGLLSVGLGSTRSVVNEGTAVNIAASVFGAWEAQENEQEPLTVDGPVRGLFTNLPALSSSTTDDFYFDSSGVQVDEPGRAALEMSYATTAAGQALASNMWRLDLTFRWPVGGASNAVQTRSFTRVFVK